MRIPLTYFNVWELEQRYGYVFESQTTVKKVNVTLFTVHEERNKVCLVHLEFKLHQHRFG